MATKKSNDRLASMILGIISICMFWTTWPAMVVAIVGLSIPKSEEHKTRDIILNLIGLIISLTWTLYILMTM